MLAEAAVVAALTVTLAGCDDREKAARQDTDKKAAALVADMEADREMLKDASRGGAELESRLRKAVNVQGGLIIIHNPVEAGMEMHVLPSSTPWMVNCGIGVTVVFGSSVTGDSSSVQNDVEVVLTSATVDPPICDAVAPRLARVLQVSQ